MHENTQLLLILVVPCPMKVLSFHMPQQGISKAPRACQGDVVGVDFWPTHIERVHQCWRWSHMALGYGFLRSFSEWVWSMDADWQIQQIAVRQLSFFLTALGFKWWSCWGLHVHSWAIASVEATCRLAPLVVDGLEMFWDVLSIYAVHLHVCIYIYTRSRGIHVVWVY